MSMAKCPWCGGDVFFNIGNYLTASRRVGFEFGLECNRCKARKHGRYKVIWELRPDGVLVCERDDREEAEKDWNMRYIGAD